MSPTDLDSWEWYKANEAMTSDQFLERLNRTEDTNTALIVGQALHNAVETALKTVRDQRQGIQIDRLKGAYDGHQVEFEFINDDKEPFEVHLDAYDTIEQDGELVFSTPAGWVHLRLKIDGLMGLVVRDLKTTGKFAAERYQDSWQWRAYLQALGPRYSAFEYHVFTLSRSKAHDTALAAGRPIAVRVRDYNMVPCFRYPAMLTHLQGVCAELAAYCEQIGWRPPRKRAMQIF